MRWKNGLDQSSILVSLLADTTLSLLINDLDQSSILVESFSHFLS